MFCNEITPLSPASLSSLGSASACKKQKQPSEEPTNGSGSGDNFCSRTQTQAGTMDETHNAMMSYIEREWALAAARNSGENAYGAYMASIGQLVQAGQQPFPLSPPIASKPVALPNMQQNSLVFSLQQQQEQDEEEVVEDEQEEVNPLTRAQRNKQEAKDLIIMINSVQIDEDEIYDSCPEVAQKINQFLQLDGVNKAIFLNYAMDQEGRYVMLKDFIEGNKQEQCKNKLYGKAYIFFEKLRILEGREKSEERLRIEAAFPCGISTKNPDAQIGGTAPCEDSIEIDDEEDSETGLQCYEYLA